jgi:hypothetical protein
LQCVAIRPFEGFRGVWNTGNQIIERSEAEIVTRNGCDLNTMLDNKTSQQRHQNTLRCKVAMHADSNRRIEDLRLSAGLKSTLACSAETWFTDSLKGGSNIPRFIQEIQECCMGVRAHRVQISVHRDSGYQRIACRCRALKIKSRGDLVYRSDFAVDVRYCLPIGTFEG